MASFFLGTENDELLVKPDVMPEMADDNVNVRVIMKRKRKRRPEHAISSDDSDKSVSPLNSDSAESKS